MSRIRSYFLHIYALDNSFDDNKLRSCGQDYFINASIWLAVPISQYIFYKQWCTNTKVDTRFIIKIQLWYTQVWEFHIWHLKTHNSLQYSSCLKWWCIFISMSSCWMYNNWTWLFYYRNNTTLGGYIGDIYYETFFDNKNYDPIGILEKGMETVHK